jgi:hypothetical protein
MRANGVRAANATRFSQTCGGHAASLRAAVNILLKLSDYAKAVTVATDLIKLEPFNDNGFFLRSGSARSGWLKSEGN